MALTDATKNSQLDKPAVSVVRHGTYITDDYGRSCKSKLRDQRGGVAGFTKACMSANLWDPSGWSKTLQMIGNSRDGAG
jgi:hypothetical protein